MDLIFWVLGIRCWVLGILITHELFIPAEIPFSIVNSIFQQARCLFYLLYYLW